MRPGAVLQQQEKLTVVQAAERPCFEDVRHPRKSTAPPKRRNAAKTIAAGACHMDAKGPNEELLRRCAVIDFDFASKQLPALRNPLTVLLYKPIGTLQMCAPYPFRIPGFLMASDMQLALCFASSDKKLKLNSAKHRGLLPKDGLGHQFGEVVNQNQMISQVGFFQDHWAIQNPRFRAIAHAQE